MIHDFMVEDAKDGPLLGALWALQHVTVNPKGLGLTPQALAERMKSVGFQEVRVFAEKQLFLRAGRVVSSLILCGKKHGSKLNVFVFLRLFSHHPSVKVKVVKISPTAR